MPRAPRRVALPAQGVFHLTSRGVDRALVFRDACDRRAFLELLHDCVRRDSWTVRAMCLMGTHYHLVVDGLLTDVSGGLHRLNGLYAQRFNARHARTGHLFGERFHAWVVRDEEHLARTIAYVLANPVRAGLCAEPRDWPWSGPRTLLDEHAFDG